MKLECQFGVQLAWKRQGSSGTGGSFLKTPPQPHPAAKTKTTYAPEWKNSKGYIAKKAICICSCFPENIWRRAPATSWNGFNVVRCRQTSTGMGHGVGIGAAATPSGPFLWLSRGISSRFNLGRARIQNQFIINSPGVAVDGEAPVVVKQSPDKVYNPAVSNYDKEFKGQTNALRFAWGNFPERPNKRGLLNHWSIVLGVKLGKKRQLSLSETTDSNKSLAVLFHNSHVSQRTRCDIMCTEGAAIVEHGL